MNGNYILFFNTVELEEFIVYVFYIIFFDAQSVLTK